MISGGIARLLRAAFGLILAATLAACITPPAAPLTELKAAVHRGRFAVTYEAQGEARREQGGFEWRSFGAKSDAPMQLLLLSPLGSTLAALQFDPAARSEQRASLSTPQGTTYAPSLPELMQQTVGWELPLQALAGWLEAQTPPQPADTLGWTLGALTRYDTGAPRLLNARHEAKNISLRLAFEEAQP